YYLTLTSTLPHPALHSFPTRRSSDLIPILSNRTLSQTVRVKENEPTLISGMTDREETRSIVGLPGFAEIPGVRYAFSSKSQSLRSEEHTSELQSLAYLVCRLLLEKKN